MISQNAKKILERFVCTAKSLLTQNVTELLQQFYGIWADGHVIPVEQLSRQDADTIHTARMLRERLSHLLAALPDTERDKDRQAVGQLIAEQAFTQLNRFCALRMCEERSLIMESVHGGYDAEGFLSYDAIAQQVGMPKYNRYKWYLLSIFDELSLELPAVFDRFSPYGLVFPDESTLRKLLDLINDPQLSGWYDDQNGVTVNFWIEDETLGWMYQNYNSLEERRKMREESAKPRNSREMAVRNQFFTPEYIVRFLTDNSLGRIWYEMTEGQSRIGEEQCKYMVRRPGESYEPRPIKEPSEILSLDPTCGSMHFGIYLFEVYEYIYMDAWDHHPQLLIPYREVHTRDSFRAEVPKLILENNIYGCEIDPRALQIAALSLWLRAQRSYGEMGILADKRPLIQKSNLVLAEAMPGNKRLLKGLMEELDKPMQKLIQKIWDKMQYVGEAGLLLKMEKEIDDEIEALRKNWTKVNQYRYADLFSTDEERAKIAMENEQRRILKENKEEFFHEITDRLKEALHQLAAKLSEEEGYENALFTDDATRGFAFIELCQKRFDCIVMNPPFGEGGEHTSGYLDVNYPTWSGNLVCAFFIRMLEILKVQGKVGAIFDRTILYNNSTEQFRISHVNDRVYVSVDSGSGVLDASVDTTTIVLNKEHYINDSVFINLYDVTEKETILYQGILQNNSGNTHPSLYYIPSDTFKLLPNSVTSYKFNPKLISLLKGKSISDRGFVGSQGLAYIAQQHYRLFYELITIQNQYRHLYNGSDFSMFYTCYRLFGNWKDDGIQIRNNPKTRIGNMGKMGEKGIGYGRRCLALNAHILKEKSFFTTNGLAFPSLTDQESFIALSFLNSSLSQYIINLYTAEHKHVGYVNKIPMPSFQQNLSDIISIMEDVTCLKRWYFSLDETNLEYHGFFSQLNITSTIESAIDSLQDKINSDYIRYQSIVKKNDSLWLALADVKSDDSFYQEVATVKGKRSYEELLSIDGASSQNIIDKKVMAQEIVQELVGMAFGRWDVAYAKGDKSIPEFGDVFDALPFMPTVSLAEVPAGYPIDIPDDGILSNQTDGNINIASRVRDVMHYLWGDRADDLEYELCQLIGCKSLQAYLEQPTGFFDYHFKRYTKSRRKAPIYWLLSSEDGTMTYWVYYPKLSKNTLPALIIKLRNENERLRSSIANAQAARDKVTETNLRAQQQQVEGMMAEMTRLIDSNYTPNHDDGVPVTSCPLVNLVSHRGWKKECQENLDTLTAGDYDWSHLAMSMFPARVYQKAKTDWCLALTHGLESICENRPKEKKKRTSNPQQQTELDI